MWLFGCVSLPVFALRLFLVFLLVSFAHIADILVDIGEKSFCYHSVGQHDRNLLFTCLFFRMYGY